MSNEQANGKCKCPKIRATKDYRLFHRTVLNRPLNLHGRTDLRRSMEEHGFHPWSPIVCYRDAHGNLQILDGQHRLGFAEKLGIAVFWIEVELSEDCNVVQMVTEINRTSRAWPPSDYARVFAEQGITAYTKGLQFAERHGLAVGTAFALLADKPSFSGIRASFQSGAFAIKDWEFADRVAAMYTRILGMNAKLKNTRFVEACIGVCRVEGFDARRLLRNAERCRDKLAPYSTREAYLDMLESIYNDRARGNLFSLKIEALKAMRNGNGKKAA